MVPYAFKRRLNSKFVPKIIALIICAIFIWGGISFVILVTPLYRFTAEHNLTPTFFWNLFGKNINLLKSYQGRTNIALFGIAGGTHDGADLTDTLIAVSIDFSKQDMLLISIPRDIWMEGLKDKINTAYHYGEKEKTKGGIVLAKAAVEEVIGQPIHYGVVMNFTGFEQLIDLVGGVDVNIDNSFEDLYYPIVGNESSDCGGDKTLACRYEKLNFESGWEHMDGARALKYVRSRQAQGDEGTDFARSKRQQKVILSLKEKLFNKDFFFNYTHIQSLLHIISKNAQFDMNWAEIITFGKFYTNIPSINFRRIGLDYGQPEKNIKGYLLNPPISESYNNAWVLIPRTKSFDEIHGYIKCQIDSFDCQMHP